MSNAKTMEARVRRPTNVTLLIELVAEAKALQINVSQARERGLARAVMDARRLQWLEENNGAIEAHNAMIERDGPILDEFRQF